MNMKSLIQEVNSNNNMINQIHKEFIKRESEMLEKALRENAEPKIRGPITAGKLKWRGIKMIEKKESSHSSSKWLEQRGKQITPKIEL